MSGANHRYEQALTLMREGLDDEEIIQITHLNRNVIAALRHDLLHPRNPQF